MKAGGRERGGAHLTYFVVAWFAGTNFPCVFPECAHAFRLDGRHSNPPFNASLTPASLLLGTTTTPPLRIKGHGMRSPRPYPLYLRLGNYHFPCPLSNRSRESPRRTDDIHMRLIAKKMAPLPKTMRAVVCAEPGGIDVLKLQDIPIPTPAKG